MSRGTEHRSATSQTGETHVVQEEEHKQHAGPGNAALSTMLPSSPPIDAEECPGDSLDVALTEALTSTEPPPTLPRIKGLISSESPALRSQLFHNSGFWAGSLWQTTPLSSDAVRSAVDPLEAVQYFTAATSAEERLQVVARVLQQCPHERPRILTDARLRTPLLNGLSGLDRLRLLQTIAEPGEVLDDPYNLLQRAVLSPNANSGTLREAWNEVAIDPGLMMRLAGDLELRSRIEALDAELAEQIRWEVAQALSPDIGASQDECDDETAVRQIYQRAGRPALRALVPLPAARLYGTAPLRVAHATEAVHTFVADVEARLRHTGLIDNPEVAAAEPDAGLHWLATTFTDYTGSSIAETVARVDAHYQRTTREGRELAACFEVMASDTETRDLTAPWAARVQRISRYLARDLHGVRGDDHALGVWLEDAKRTLHASALTDNADAVDTEQRIADGLRAVGTAYSNVFGPIEVVFEGEVTEIRRREILTSLGLRADAALQGSLVVLEQVRLQEPTMAGDERVQALSELLKAARKTGLELAHSVSRRSTTEAEKAASTFESLGVAFVVENTLDSADLLYAIPVIEAAYASHGGDLRHGVAQLENSDLIFSYLGMRSTGAALRREGDERSDTVLGHEYHTLSATRELFDAIATRHPGSALGLAEKALTAAAELVEHDGTQRSPAHAVADLYVQTFGIELSHHLNVLPFSTALVELKAMFGERAAPSPDVPEVQRVHRDYFLLDGRVPDDIDPDGITNAGNIQAMTEHHVEHLTDLAASLDGLVGERADGLPRFQKAVGDLRVANGLQLVRPAFHRANGATLEFYLHASHARGGLSATDLQTGLMSLDEQEQSPFTIDLLRYARADDWTKALVLIEKASAEQRQRMLADGASMVLLRNEAPPAAWAPVYDALNGELHLADLVADESAWTDTAEAAGSWLSWLGVPLIGRLMGEDEEEVAFDVETIVAAMREDMTLEQSALAGARAAVDGDIDARLDASLGQGDARMTADAQLARTLGKRANGEVADASGPHLQRLGLGSSAAANNVDNDFYVADNLRVALESMSDAERIAAQSDAVFLDRIDRATRSHPDQATQLFDLLYQGKDGAEAARVASYGTGTDGSWRGQGFEVVSTLAGLSVDERAAIAVDPERTEEWLRAARTDNHAEEQARALLDTARRLAGAEYDASRSDESPACHDDFRQDPVAAAAYEAFVAQGIAQFRVAMVSSDPYSKSVAVAQGLRDSALSFQAGSSEYATSGFPITEAMTAIWLTIAADLQSHDLAKHLGRTNRADALERTGAPSLETYAFSRGFNVSEEQILADLRRWYAEDTGDIELHAFRAAASSDDVAEMVRLVKAMPIRKVARRLTSLLDTGLHGEPSLQSVYEPFRDADAELAESEEGEPGHQQLLAAQQLARDTLTDHPVTVSEGADLNVRDNTSSLRTLDDFGTSQQDQITSAIRGRFRDITPALVVDLLRAEPQHASLLWNAGRRVSASVRSSRDLATRSLTAGSWGAEYITTSDDQAATGYATLAHGYQRAIAQQDISDEELERLSRLESEFRVSMGEFIAAKQKAAKVVSGVTSAAIGAVVTALTAGTGAPVAAALLTTALSGGASIAIHEGMLRDDYDSERAAAELGVELLKTAVTAHFEKFWAAGKASMHSAMLNSGRGRQLIAAHAALEGVGNNALGPLGMSLASSAVDTTVGEAGELVWKLLDPSLYEHGFTTALDDGLAQLEASLTGLGPAVISGMLAEMAKEAGKRAAASSPSTTGPNARSLGAALPEAPDPEREPKAFLEYLRAQLAKIPGEMWSETVKTGVTGLVNAGVAEGQEYILTGDDQLDVDRTLGVFQRAGLAGLKKGRDAALGAGFKAQQQRRDAVAAHERSPGHQARMDLMDELASDLSPTERELLRQWSRANAFEPVNESLGTPEGSDAAQRSLELAHAQARLDLAAFKTEVLAPIERQLDRQEATWGADQSDDDREAYRSWVLASPAGIESRLAVRPSDYVRRRDVAKRRVEEARGSDGYRSLSRVEREWFDHAAAHPSAIADLTSDTVALQLQVNTIEQADAFQRQMQAIHTEVARAVLADVLGNLDADQRAFAEQHGTALTRGLAMSPSDLDQNRAVVLSRVQAAYQEAQDASVLQNAIGTDPTQRAR